VQTVFPETGNNILDDLLKETTPVAIRRTAGELRPAPTPKKYHRPTAAELPALPLDAAVSWRPKQLEHHLVWQPGTDPAVLFWNHLEVITAQARNTMSYAVEGLLPGDHPEFGVLRDCRFSGSQADVACFDLVVPEVRKWDRSVAPAAMTIHAIIGIQSVVCATTRTLRNDCATNPKSEANSIARTA